MVILELSLVFLNAQFTKSFTGLLDSFLELIELNIL